MFTPSPEEQAEQRLRMEALLAETRRRTEELPFAGPNPGPKVISLHPAPPDDVPPVPVGPIVAPSEPLPGPGPEVLPAVDLSDECDIYPECDCGAPSACPFKDEPAPAPTRTPEL